jgi:hypothetical protein
VGLIMICAYPAIHHAARGAILDLLQQITGRSMASGAFFAAEPLVFFAATLGLALWCDNLGELMRAPPCHTPAPRLGHLSPMGR